MTLLLAPIAFEVRLPPGGSLDLGAFYRRAPLLVNAALGLGVRRGCRIMDEKAGFDFRWWPAP